MRVLKHHLSQTHLMKLRLKSVHELWQRPGHTEPCVEPLIPVNSKEISSKGLAQNLSHHWTKFCHRVLKSAKKAHVFFFKWQRENVIDSLIENTIHNIKIKGHVILCKAQDL